MASQWLKNLSHKAAHVKMLNPVYNASLGKLDDILSFETFPHDLFAGDAGRGRWVASGQLEVNGNRIELDQKNWLIGATEQNTPFFEKLHSFGFLIELKALGGEVGRKAAREITKNWLNIFQNYHHITWSPDLTAQRLINWLIVYPFAFEAASDELLYQIHYCFYRQYNHLLNVFNAQSEMNPFDRYSLLWSLIIIQCHCQDLHDEILFQSHLQLLQGIVDDISLKDGGLIARNPQNILDLTKSLIQLRHSLVQYSATPPLWLIKKIETSARMMMVLTHGDKDFPQFQGCVLPNKQDIDQAIKQSGLRLRRSNISYSEFGYTSLRNGRSSVLIDHATSGNHNAPLAFEMSYGQNRVIVSCGTHLIDSKWMEGLSLMAAHSLLAIQDIEAKQNLSNIKTSLENLNGAALFCGSHEGYNASHGLNHTRRLYLDDDGEDFRGEELLTRNIAIKPISIIIRFHLHPSVKASLVENKTTVLLRLPAGSGWVFKTQTNNITLEDSVYCSDGFNVRKSQQIVMRFSMEDLSMQIKWALKKQ